jgi:hypothetical protein
MSERADRRCGAGARRGRQSANHPLFRLLRNAASGFHHAIGKLSITFDMLWPLLAMMFGFTLYFGAVLMTRLRAEVIRRERDASWLRGELA